MTGRTGNRPDYWRQTDIVRQSVLDRITVTLIGAGGIGSPTAIALTKMGVRRLTVYDPDKIEAHNLPNQFYRLSDVGRLKVEALADICKDFAGVTITAIPEKYTNQPISGIVICAVDTMDARIAIWPVMRYNPVIARFIDARMGAEFARIHIVRPFDLGEVAEYEKTLYTSEQAVQLPCTARAIIYNVFGIAEVLTKVVKMIARNEEIPSAIVLNGFSRYMANTWPGG